VLFDSSVSTTLTTFVVPCDICDTPDTPDTPGIITVEFEFIVCVSTRFISELKEELTPLCSSFASEAAIFKASEPPL
jgi:hypothetical protein